MNNAARLRCVVHHDPDLTVVGCVACGELVDEPDLVADTGHFSVACCTFHPYHSWCYRAAPPDPRPWTRCADCGVRLAAAEVLAAARWLAGFHRRLHRRALKGTAGESDASTAEIASVAPRPPAVRFVRARQRGTYVPRVPRLKPLFTGADRDSHGWLGRSFEIVHASACVGEPAAVVRLRTAPDDIELRLVYADELEQAGDDERAEFVRHDAARRRGERFARLEERLRNIRASLPSSWREAVVRRR